MSSHTFPSLWSVKRKVRKLFDIESQQQCLFSSVVWCWVGLSHAEYRSVLVRLWKRCEEGRALKGISRKTWFPSFGGSMHGMRVLHLVPASPAHAVTIVPCPLLKLSASLKYFFCQWLPEPGAAVTRSWALASSASLPHAQSKWSQTKVLASGHVPPVTWADRPDISFTLWENKALPGVLEKRSIEGCATRKDNQEEEHRNSRLMLWQITEPDNISVCQGKRKKARARHCLSYMQEMTTIKSKGLFLVWVR